MFESYFRRGVHAYAFVLGLCCGLSVGIVIIALSELLSFGNELGKAFLEQE